MKRIILLAVFLLIFLLRSVSAYYSPEQGRWLTRDPIEEEGCKVLARESVNELLNELFNEPDNLYVFVVNDPINSVDHIGLFKKDANGNFIEIPGGYDTLRHDEDKKEATVQIVFLLTDDGKDKILAYKFVSGDPGMKTDCHGLTFAEGKYWINNEQVEDILKGDCYKPTNNPKAGDIVVYRDVEFLFWTLDKGVRHSATVTKLNEKGSVVELKGISGTNTEIHYGSPFWESFFEGSATYYTKDPCCDEESN